MKFLIGLFLIVFLSKVIASDMSAEGLTELRRYRPLHDCYEKFLQIPGQAGKKNGKLTLDLKLNKTGDVLAIKENSNKSTLHEEVLNSCLFQSLKKLKFTKEVSGRGKEISATLDFPIKKGEN